MHRIHLNFIHVGIYLSRIPAARTEHRAARDLFDGLNFSNNLTKQTERYGQLKEVLSHSHSLRCPRTLSRESPWKIQIELNSRGYEIIKPNRTELAHFTLLVRKHARKEIVNPITNGTTFTLDKKCENRENLLETIKMYGNQDHIEEAISTYSIKDLASAIISTLHEIIAIQKLCNMSDIEMDNVLQRYLLASTGIETNECEIDLCTMKPQAASETYMFWLGILLLISSSSYVWYSFLKTRCSINKQKTCLRFGQEAINLGPRLPPNMERNVQNQIELLNQRTFKQGSISFNTDSTSTEIYPQNFEVSRMVDKRTREKYSAIFGFTTFLLTFAYISASMYSEPDLQIAVCSLIDNVRHYIL